MKRNKKIKWIILTIITFPLSMIVIMIKILHNQIKYIKETDVMEEKYHNGYCPINKQRCSYNYCTFWNKDKCDLKK